MRTATALHVLPVVPTFDQPVEPAPGQIPLPFNGVRPVLPAPIERATTDELGHPLRQRAAHFMQALVEVLSGERAPRQMAAWMAPDVYDQLHARLAARARVPRRVGVGGTARIASVHVSMINDETAEIAGRMVHRGRSRALAVRLELQTSHRGQRAWRCTALVWA
jgi:hypothetical protein